MKNILFIIIIGLAAILGFLLGSKPTPEKLGASSFSSATNTSVACSAATSTVVITADGGRVYAVFVNDSANDIDLTLGQAATSSRITLKANGGAYEINQDNLFLEQVNCIASTATSTLGVTYR